jgi:hypothetical protein
MPVRIQPMVIQLPHFKNRGQAALTTGNNKRAGGKQRGAPQVHVFYLQQPRALKFNIEAFKEEAVQVKKKIPGAENPVAAYPLLEVADE